MGVIGVGALSAGDGAFSGLEDDWNVIERISRDPRDIYIHLRQALQRAHDRHKAKSNDCQLAAVGRQRSQALRYNSSRLGEICGVG